MHHPAPTHWTTRAAVLALSFVLAIVGVTGGTAGAAPEGAGFQPDLKVSANGTTFVGDETFNTGGRGQAVSRSAARGTTANFHVGLQIEMPVTLEDVSDITLTGCGGDSSFNVKYYLLTADITSQVVGGGFVINPFISGADAILAEPSSMPFRVAVKVKRAAPVGATLTCRVRATTESGSTDTVKITVRRS